MSKLINSKVHNGFVRVMPCFEEQNRKVSKVSINDEVRFFVDKGLSSD